MDQKTLEIEKFIKTEVLDLINRNIQVKVSYCEKYSFCNYMNIKFTGICLGEVFVLNQAIDINSFFDYPEKRVALAEGLAEKLIMYIIRNRLK